MGNVNDSRLLLEQKGFAISKTSGSSMRPLIWGGDHCVVVTPLSGAPRVGDIIMFMQGEGGKGKSIVHRVIKIRNVNGEPQYITRGDNCLATETVRLDQVIGGVSEVHRITGYRPWHALPLRQFAVDYPAHTLYTRLWLSLWPLRRLYYLARAHTHLLLAKITG